MVGLTGHFNGFPSSASAFLSSQTGPLNSSFKLVNLLNTMSKPSVKVKIKVQGGPKVLDGLKKALGNITERYNK